MELLAADVPDQCRTRRNAHAETWERRILADDPFDRRLHRERRARGRERVPRLLDGRVPDRDDGIASELDDRAAAREDDRDDRGEVAIQHRDRLARGTALGERREALEVSEERGHVTDVAAELRLPRIGDERARYLRRKVLSEQALHHRERAVSLPYEDVERDEDDDRDAGDVEDEHRVD